MVAWWFGGPVGTYLKMYKILYVVKCLNEGGNKGLKIASFIIKTANLILVMKNRINYLLACNSTVSSSRVILYNIFFCEYQIK